MVEADRILAVFGALDSPKPILMHGFNETTWPFLQRAIDHQFSIRIGLEDTRLLPDGSRAASNAQLIRAAVNLVAGGRE
jgi:uncharacterized protein (DUF849 family)